MKPWHKAGLSLLAAVLVSGLTYYFVGGVELIYPRLVSAAAATVVGVFVYAAVGLLNLRPSASGESRRPVDLSSWVKLLFRPLSWRCQVLRVVMVVYFGGATYGLARNALLDPRNIRALSVLVGCAIAMVGLSSALQRDPDGRR